MRWPGDLLSSAHDRGVRRGSTSSACVNAGMLGLVAWLLDGFHIAGLGSAMLGTVIVGLTGWFANAAIGDGGRYEVVVVRRRID